MALTFERKQELVGELHSALEGASTVIAADACGLSVAEADELRSGIRSLGARAQVVPNRLALRAIENTRFTCLKDMFRGPTMLTWCEADPAPLASFLHKFDADNLQLKGISFGETLLPADQIARVASLPSREQALAQLAGVLLAPVTGLASALAGVPRNLALVLAAVRDSKTS